MKAVMRTAGDRVRHALLFEITLLVICVPLLSWIFKKPMGHMGGIGVIMSLTAMGWNYVYNIIFDHALLRMGKPLYPRSFKLRMAHALLFEVGFMGVSIPMVMWAMDFTFMKALAFDVAFLVMVPVYTIFYNWIYDQIFPVPQTANL